MREPFNIDVAPDVVTRPIEISRWLATIEVVQDGPTTIESGALSATIDVGLPPIRPIEISGGPPGPQGIPGPQGPPGPQGSGGATIWGETPTGSINGTNRSYTTANSYTPGLLAVFLNGLRLRRANDYVETGNQSFQFLSAPLPGDSLSIDYM